MTTAAPAPPASPASFFPVYKRELGQYLHTPGTYVALAFFLLLSGACFTLVLGDFVDASTQVREGKPLTDAELPLNVTIRVITQLFSLLNFLLLFVVPVLTMRLVAEERTSGSLELLLSTPLRNRDILLGKYLAALTVGIFLLAACSLYPLLCLLYSRPEPAVIASCQLGLFLVLAAYTSLGLFASCVTASQITAAVLSFVLLLLFQMAPLLFKEGPAGSIAAGLGLQAHAEAFTQGVVALPHAAYFVLFSLFFLFLSAQVLDLHRGRAGR